MIGEVIGNYRVLSKLGQGGMGEVYLAEHRRIPRRVAVKVLLKDLSVNQELVERFFAEARATAMINHPNIIDIVDCDLHEGRAYIVMSLLEGEVLGARLQRLGPFTDAAELVTVVRQIAEGVGAAHAKGIVHRDLKPDNVFLTVGATGPQVKILDFGIAKLATEGSASNTRTGTIIGTPTYMSPEQCRGTGRVDRRADIYSLGCIVYEMVCGQPPFVREGFGELIAAHLGETPPAPSSIIPGLLPESDTFLAALLAKKPDDRIQTMEEVVARLATVRFGTLGSPRTLPSAVAPEGGSGLRASAGGTKLLPDREPPDLSAPSVVMSAAPMRARAMESTTLSENAGEASPESPGRRRGPLIATVAIAATVAAGVAIFVMGRGHAPETEKPASSGPPLPEPAHEPPKPELVVTPPPVPPPPANVPVKIAVTATPPAIVAPPPKHEPPAPKHEPSPKHGPPPPKHESIGTTGPDKKKHAAHKDVVDYGTTDI